MNSFFVRKLSDKTYPGFEEFKSYFIGCDGMKYPGDRIYADETNNHTVWFDDAVSGSPHDDIEAVLNGAEFRHFYPLLPSGIHPLVAFCQLMILTYRSKLGIESEFGTYDVRFHVWQVLRWRHDSAQCIDDLPLHGYYFVPCHRLPLQTIVCL